MFDQRKNEIVVFDKKLAVRSLLALVLAACFAVGNAQQQPSHCTMVRPRSTEDCSKGDQDQRYFFKESVGRCERFGICRNDSARLDQSTENINYFLAMEDCEKDCFVCPRLKAIANGNVTVGRNRTAGNTANYTCNDGYALFGSSTSTCLSTGNWSDTEPHCRVTCPAPPEVLNTLIIPHKSPYFEGSTVTYYCSEVSMELVGESRRTCLSNGSWSGTEPHCAPEVQLQCPPPELIEHGYPIAPERSVGSSSIYICDEGYTLIGNATRVCDENGMWDGTLPFCGRIKITYNSEDVTNSELRIAEQQPDVAIECCMSPQISSEIMPVWRVTDGEDLPYLGEYERYVHGKELHHSTLFFEHFFPDHAHNYTCKIGELEATVLLDMESVPPPPPTREKPALQFTPPLTQIAQQGGAIDMVCLFTGCPVPNVTWFHFDESIHSDGRRQVLKDHFNEHLTSSSGYTLCLLKIQRLSMEDVGEYRCVGENSEGNASSDPTIVEIINTAAKKRSVDEQSSYHSHCRADSRAVTVMGKVRRSKPRRSGEILHSYRVKVSRVLRNSAGYSPESKPLTVLLAHNPNTVKLRRDSTYVLTGHIIDSNVMFVSSDNLIHPHSLELEDSISSC